MAALHRLMQGFVMRSIRAAAAPLSRTIINIWPRSVGRSATQKRHVGSTQRWVPWPWRMSSGDCSVGDCTRGREKPSRLTEHRGSACLRPIREECWQGSSWTGWRHGSGARLTRVKCFYSVVEMIARSLIVTYADRHRTAACIAQDSGNNNASLAWRLKVTKQTKENTKSTRMGKPTNHQDAFGQEDAFSARAPSAQWSTHALRKDGETVRGRSPRWQIRVLHDRFI